MDLVLHNWWLAYNHSIHHAALVLVIMILKNLEIAQILMEAPMNVDSEREMREIAHYLQNTPRIRIFY